MEAVESHILLLLRSSDCFVAKIYLFKPNKLYLVWWLQKKGMLVSVRVPGRWKFLKIQNFFPCNHEFEFP